MPLNLSIDDVCDVIRIGLQAENVKVTDVSLMNNATLRIEFTAKQEESVDVKSEVAFAMSFAHGFLYGDGEYDIELDNIAVEVNKADGAKLMHAISPIAVVGSLATVSQSTGWAIQFFKITLMISCNPLRNGKCRSWRKECAR